MKNISLPQRLCASAVKILILSIVLRTPPSEAIVFDTIYVKTVGIHSAAISWQSDTLTMGQIEYGLASEKQDLVSIGLDHARPHLSLLFDLLEGEHYTFRVKARTKSGDEIRSNLMGFRTHGTPFPKILQAGVANPTVEGGTLVWKSNIPTRGVFECGYDTSYGFRKEDPEFGYIHEVVISRFNPRKVIHYRITAVDTRGLEPAPTISTFKTAEKNIALGARVTGTFDRSAEPGVILDSPPIISRVTDGQADYFGGMASSGDPARAMQWVEIDLGKITFAGEINTLWWQLACPTKFSVKHSLDQERWISLGDTFDASKGLSQRSGSGDPAWELGVPVGNVLIRYVRIEIPYGAPYYRRFSKFTFVSLFEVKVFPPDEFR